MAMKVPQYSRQITSPVDVPSVRVSGAGAGAGMATMARGLTGAGQQLSVVANKMQIDEDKAMVIDATNQFRTWDREYRNNPNTGIFSKQNKDAVGSYDASVTAYDKAISDIESRMTNDNQKRAFRQWVSSAKNSSLDSISRFEAQQRKNWQVATAKQSMETEASSMIANYADQAQMKDAFERVGETLKAMVPGMGEEFYTQQMAAYKSKVHVAKIEAMLNDEDSEFAKTYYKEYEKEIDGSIRDDIKKAVRTAEMTTFVQEESGNLFAKYGLDGEAQATKWIRDHYSGDKENKLMSAVGARYVDERRFKAQRDQRAFDGLYDSIESADSYNSALKMIENSGLDARKRNSLKSWAMQTYNVGKKGTPVSSPETVREVQRLVDTETMFTDYPNWKSFFGEFGGGLSYTDRNKYHAMYTKKEKGEDPTIVYSVDKAVKDQMKELKIKTSEEQSKFVDSFNAYVAFEEKSTGKPVPITRQIEILKDISEKKVLEKKDWWPDPTIRGYELPPGYEFNEQLNQYTFIDPDTGNVYDRFNNLIGRMVPRTEEKK